MRTSWLLGALVTFLIGFLLIFTIIGIIIAIPLIALSLIILVLGIIMPGKRRVVHIHHYRRKR